jgi:hypothetical protein
MDGGVPREHDRTAGKRLAGELVLPFVHHAVLVDAFAAHLEVAGVDDDAAPARVPVEPELEDRQAGLRGDRHAHRVGDLEAVHAGELLLGEEEEHEAAQLVPTLRKIAGRGVPQRIVDAMPRQHAPAAPVA